MKNTFRSYLYSAGACVLLAFASQASANVVNYGLSWTGDSGYSASGSFSYDTASEVANTINQSDLLGFSFSFYDPADTLLKTYGLGEAILFSFHSDTFTIDQGPGFNLQLGVVSPTDYFLIRANGCTGNQMVLYQGDGDCTTGTFLDHNGTLEATVVPEPVTLALFALGLAGLGFSRRKAA